MRCKKIAEAASRKKYIKACPTTSCKIRSAIPAAAPSLTHAKSPDGVPSGPQHIEKGHLPHTIRLLNVEPRKTCLMEREGGASPPPSEGAWSEGQGRLA